MYLFLFRAFVFRIVPIGSVPDVDKMYWSLLEFYLYMLLKYSTVLNILYVYLCTFVIYMHEIIMCGVRKVE